jgi:hypothetical protein
MDPVVATGITEPGLLSRCSQSGEKFFTVGAVALCMFVPLDHSSPEKSGSAETAPIDKEMPHIREMIDRPTLFEHISLPAALPTGARVYQ